MLHGRRDYASFIRTSQGAGLNEYGVPLNLPDLSFRRSVPRRWSGLFSSRHVPLVESVETEE